MREASCPGVSPELRRSDRFRKIFPGFARAALCLISAVTLPAHGSANLEEADLSQLLETTVTTASKYEQKGGAVAATVNVITRAQIKDFGWRTLGEALSSLPGLYTTYDRQYTYLGARGFGLPGDYNTRILLAIDGNRINDPVYDAANVGREFPLDMDLVERIEYVAGPGGAIYGQNAMFGVINVITRNGAAMDGGELAAAWVSRQARADGRASWGKTLDNGTDILLSASILHARGEDMFITYPGAAPDGGDISGTAANQDGERAKSLFARIGRGPVAFGLIYADRRKDDPTAGFRSDPLVAGQYQRDAYFVTQFQYQDNFHADTVNLLARLFHGQYRYTGSYQYSRTPSLSTGIGTWNGAEARILYTGLARHALMVGLEMQDNPRIEQAEQSGGLPAAGDGTRVLGSGYRIGIYAQDEWHLSDAWAATLGLRLDFNNATGARSSPRAGLIWSPSPDSALKLLYGHAHRAPNAYERDYADGVSQVRNPNLRGETIETLELVADHRLSPGFSLRGSVYQWNMADIISLGVDPASGLPQYQPGNRIKSQGVELSAAKIWRSGAHLRASVTYQDTGFVNGDNLPNSPRWLARLGYSGPLNWNGMRLGYESRCDGRRRAIDGSFVGGYCISSLNLIASRWARGLEVSLHVRNLMDHAYQSPVANTNWQTRLSQDGRSVELKFDYQF